MNPNKAFKLKFILYVCTEWNGWNAHELIVIEYKKKLIWPVYPCDIESKFINKFDDKFDMDQSKYTNKHALRLDYYRQLSKIE